MQHLLVPHFTPILRDIYYAFSVHAQKHCAHIPRYDRWATTPITVDSGHSMPETLNPCLFPLSHNCQSCNSVPLSVRRCRLVISSLLQIIRLQTPQHLPRWFVRPKVWHSVWIAVVISRRRHHPNNSLSHDGDNPGSGTMLHIHSGRWSCSYLPIL